MSVIVTVSMEGDPRRLEEHAAANADSMRTVVDRAGELGLIAHRFYGSDDGRLLVIDEWPDEQSFHAFFASAGDEVRRIMAAAGVTSEPQVTFWRKLDTRDEVGWE